METRRQMNIMVIAVFIFMVGQAYGANATTNNRNNSRNRSRRILRPVSRQSRKITRPSSFTPDMPFSDAIDILRNSTRPPLNIAVLWKDLEENADVYPETPIRMNGLSRVPLRTHLKVLLMSVSGNGGERLGYVVRNGVIIIATQSSLPKRRVARVYDISDLVAPPANYRFRPGFGSPFGNGGGGIGFGGPGLYGGTSGIGSGVNNFGSIGTGYNRNSYIGGGYGGYGR